MNRAFAFSVLMLWYGVAVAVEQAPPTKAVTVSLDRDLIEFVKTAIWVGSAFLAVYALIGVAFFGWDVRKARASITDAQKEVKDQLKELREDYKEMKELKEKLEELGAKLQEVTEPAPAAAPSPVVAKRSDLDLIREVIASSNYEWTTIGRIMKRTSLSREAILREARSAPDIQIGHGLQTNDHLFKFKNAR